MTFVRMCRVGDITGVQAAIDNGDDVNQEDSYGQTGLMLALINSQNSVVQLLLNHPQIDINKAPFRKPTGAIKIGKRSCALHYAVETDNHEGLKALLDRQDLTIINQRSYGGWTPIMGAVVSSAVNCFNLLLADPRVDLDTRDDYQRSPEEVHR